MERRADSACCFRKGVAVQDQMSDRSAAWAKAIAVVHAGLGSFISYYTQGKAADNNKQQA